MKSWPMTFGASVWLFEVGNLIFDHGSEKLYYHTGSQKSIKLHRNCESMADHAWSNCKIFFENEFWTTQRSGNNLCRHASDSADEMLKVLPLKGLQSHATVWTDMQILDWNIFVFHQMTISVRKYDVWNISTFLFIYNGSK